MFTMDQFSILLQTAAIIGGGAYFIWSIKASVAILVAQQGTINDKLVKMEAAIDKLSTAAVELARQDERLNAMDVRMQELSNRIVPPNHPKKRGGI